MMKKVLFLFAIGTFAMVVSCKNSDATNGDPSAGGLPNTQNAVISQPDILPTINSDAPKVAKSPVYGKFPVMEFQSTIHDFGKILADSKVAYTFHFKNTGGSDLIIDDAKSSCGCTIPEYSKEQITPGASGMIKVSFNSAGKYGNQQKNITITTNTQQGTEILVIKASINPKA